MRLKDIKDINDFWNNYFKLSDLIYSDGHSIKQQIESKVDFFICKLIEDQIKDQIRDLTLSIIFELRMRNNET